MNILKSFAFMSLSFILAFNSNAQTAEEIIDTYYEVIGGKDAWQAVEGMKFSAKVNQGGMEIPLEIVQTKEGISYTKVSFQGMDFMQGVYDGESLWNSNFQTMKPEKVSSEELENHKLNLNDFPDPLLNWKANGYTAELIGTETFDGTETHKVKVVKEPITIDGEQIEDFEFYFFDMDSGVLIGMEKEMKEGPMKGVVSESKFSDYDEVDGLYFPFSISQGVKDGESQALAIDKIELNPTIDKAMLAFPSAPAEDEKK